MSIVNCDNCNEVYSQALPDPNGKCLCLECEFPINTPKSIAALAERRKKNGWKPDGKV